MDMEEFRAMLRFPVLARVAPVVAVLLPGLRCIASMSTPERVEPAQTARPDESVGATADWEKRVADSWSAIDDYEPAVFVDRIRTLVAELPAGNAIGLFELGCAQDSTGHPDLAVPLYRAALAAGLAGIRRRRATIQLASSLRNLGNAREAVDLLAVEVDAGSDELDGAVQAFLALALADLGQEREALAHSLTALSRYLPRYNRSLARYAAELSVTSNAAPRQDAP